MEKTINDINETILVQRESQVEYHILEYCWFNGDDDISIEQYIGFYMNKLDLSEMSFQEFIRANEETIKTYTLKLMDKDMLTFHRYADFPIITENEFEQMVLEARCPRLVAVRMDWR